MPPKPFLCRDQLSAPGLTRVHGGGDAPCGARGVNRIRTHLRLGSCKPSFCRTGFCLRERLAWADIQSGSLTSTRPHPWGLCSLTRRSESAFRGKPDEICSS